MRGPAPKFVLDPGLLGLNDQENYEKNTGPPLLGQELLYNLNLVVDMEQVISFSSINFIYQFFILIFLFIA